MLGFGGNPLINIIANGEWKRASQMIQDNGNLVRKWSVAPSLTGGVAAADILPIHQACKMDTITVQFLETLLWAYPESLKKRETGFRRIALHIAIRARAPEEVIFFILDKYPQGAAVQDVLGRVPLHYAISNHSSMRVIQSLITICPATTRAADNLGWTPLHVASNMARSIEMVDILIECGAESVVSVTKKGNSPLMCATMSSGPDKQIIITRLMEEEAKFEKTAYFKNFRNAENEAMKSNHYYNGRPNAPVHSSRFWGIRKLKRSNSFRLVV